MKLDFRCLTYSLLALSALFSPQPANATDIKKKEEAVASIEKRKADMIKLSDQIWAFAETALREHKSSKALADYAEQVVATAVPRRARFERLLDRRGFLRDAGQRVEFT